MSFQAYTIPFYLDGFNGRQLATVITTQRREELIQYMKAKGGFADGDWYRFFTQDTFHGAMDKTRALGGNVYDLPLKLGD